ncbi:hypothetical protein G6F68_020740 [Rhizopus microsporus]|nr:hypothetical protein G6F68_020740 [Rhizopus microsporus]
MLPGLAAADEARTLDTVQVTAPIATESGSATKTDTPLREIPQRCGTPPAPRAASTAKTRAATGCWSVVSNPPATLMAWPRWKAPGPANRAWSPMAWSASMC